jgi:hypothetical protein
MQQAAATPPASAVPRRLSFSVLSQEDWRSHPELLREWGRLVSEGEPLNLLYASPVWFEHLACSDASAWSLSVVRDDANCHRAVTPFQRRPFSLDFAVKRKTVARLSLVTEFLSPAEPVLPSAPDVSVALFDGLFQAVPDCGCVFIPSVRTDSCLWRFLQGEGSKSYHYFVYVPGGLRTWHWLEIGDRSRGFLHILDRKSRYNLRRGVRLLTEKGGGSAECVRVDSASQIDDFLRAAVAVSERSWQRKDLGPRVNNAAHEVRRFKELAERGLLRSYLLTCGGQAIAFVIGYQYQQVFYYVEIGYDKAWAPFSPGTVLLYLLLEDLFQHSSVSVVNFGSGDAAYKRRFASHACRDATVLLLRRNARNGIAWACHSLFTSALGLARRVVARRGPE